MSLVRKTYIFTYYCLFISKEDHLKYAHRRAHDTYDSDVNDGVDVMTHK